MSEFYRFAGDHPILTVVLALFVAVSIETIVTSIAVACRRSK